MKAIVNEMKKARDVLGSMLVKQPFFVIPLAIAMSFISLFMVDLTPSVTGFVSYNVDVSSQGGGLVATLMNDVQSLRNNDPLGYHIVEFLFGAVSVGMITAIGLSYVYGEIKKTNTPKKRASRRK